MKYLVGSLVLMSSFVNADTWLTSSNRMAKGDIQFLANRSVITTPITTFPLVWDTIIPQLEAATALTTAEEAAVNRLLNEYRRSHQYQVEAKLASDKMSLPAAPDRQFDDASLNISKSFSTEKIKAKLDADLVNGNLAGSYFAIEQSGWLFYLSQQEQFWGPNNDASLIFSDYALPAPAIGLQRASSEAFDLPILSWFGPWTFKAQMAQLESNRAVPNAKLWSARFNFRPIRSLEIGLTHAAQWGGDSFGNGLGDFFDVITGKEYCIDGGTNCDSSRKSKFGNQLAGIDFNLQINIFGNNTNFYGQTVGEDAPTNGVLPADKVTMFGFSSYSVTEYGLLKWFVETIDSNLSCDGKTNIKNCFYEHTAYQNGYRYKGIPIGSQYDNDSRSYVFGASITNNEHFAEVKIKKLSLNEDSSDIQTITGAGGHYLVDNKTELTIVEYSHQYDWSANQRIKFDLQSKLQGSLPNENDHIVQILYQHNF